MRKKKATSLMHGVGLIVTQGTERGERGDAAGWAQVKLGRGEGAKRGSRELGQQRRWTAQEESWCWAAALMRRGESGRARAVRLALLGCAVWASSRERGERES